MKYYLIVGEASGDLHASHLMTALKAEDPQAEFRFFGGDLMAAVGGTLVKHYKELAYMGFIPVLLHLRTIFANMKRCKEDIAAWQPDVLILVDYPGFNLNIAKFVHARTQIPVFYYISPKIWAWKEHRIRNIKRDVDELFTTLLFITIIFMVETAYCKYIVPTICNFIDVLQDQRSKRINKIQGNTKRNGRLSMKLFHKTIDDGKEKTENSILYSHEEEVRLDRERIKKEKDEDRKSVV